MSAPAVAAGSSGIVWLCIGVAILGGAALAWHFAAPAKKQTPQSSGNVAPSDTSYDTSGDNGTANGNDPTEQYGPQPQQYYDTPYGPPNATGTVNS